MTPRTLAETLLKVWGVLYVVRCIVALPGPVSQVFRRPDFHDNSFRYVAGWNLVQVLLLGIAGATLMAFAEVIASRLVPSGEEVAVMHGSAGLARIALGTLGAYLLVTGLSDLAFVLAKLAAKPEFESNVSYLWRNGPSELASAVVRSVGGMLLLLGKEGAARVWQGWRGTSVPQDPGAV